MAMLLITHDMGIVAEVADERRRDALRPHRRAGTGRRHLPQPAASLHATTAGRHAASWNSQEPAHAAAERSTPLLSVRGLVKVFEGRRGLFGGGANALRAVDDASFDLYPGENLGIVGESGSGKTTLGRLILRTVGAECRQRHLPRPATAARPKSRTHGQGRTAAIPPRRPAGVPGPVRLAQPAHDREGGDRRSAGHQRPRTRPRAGRSGSPS